MGTKLTLHTVCVCVRVCHIGLSAPHVGLGRLREAWALWCGLRGFPVTWGPGGRKVRPP